MKYEKGILVLDESQILINDSCVLFDLVDLELLKEFFQLEYSFLTTPQVVGEITDNSQIIEIEKYIQNQILMVDSMGLFETIQNIYDKYPGLSFADSSVLELASRVDGILLSADKRLRNISKGNNLEVKGVLWVINELVDKKIITDQVAIQKLKNYSKINVRAPIKEINALVNILINQ